ncbi:MAG: hypothetical protein R2856_19555 [Caldilineaceae bacterium]
MEVLEIEPDVQDAPCPEISHVDGHIEFKDVSFRYRDEYTDVLKSFVDGGGGRVRGIEWGVGRGQDDALR